MMRPSCRIRSVPSNPSSIAPSIQRNSLGPYREEAAEYASVTSQRCLGDPALPLVAEDMVKTEAGVEWTGMLHFAAALAR